MKLAHECSPATILVAFILTVSGSLQRAWAVGETVVSQNGVTIHVLREPHDTKAETLSVDQLPKQVSGIHKLGLETETVLVGFTPETGEIEFWTRSEDHLTHSGGTLLTRGGEVLLNSASVPSQVRIVSNDKEGVALEIADRQEGLCHVIVLSKDGILQVRQPADRSISIRTTLRYALVPSLIGTDLLYDPETLPPGKTAYLPSMNMVVGLQERSHGMLVAVWPPGNQVARVRVDETNDVRRIDSFELDTAGQPVFISFIHHPNIWHAERLREEYLETDTPIKWQRPFDARWIGRFFIDSDGYDFPFYFLAQRHKLWGRCIRGWHYYPVWFDGDMTMVHFEKKFPPIGELLVYYLDTYDEAEQPSPVSVMQKSLGKEAAARLLDFEGSREQVLLEHHNAVCAMSDQIVSHFARDAGAPTWATVKQYSADVATFIRLIRERLFQFDKFAVEIQDLLDTEQQRHPSLSSALEPSRELLAEIRDIVEFDLPEASLEEVGQWTGSITKLSPTDKTSVEAAKALTRQCRQVAGTQDDMARNLSIVTIRLMEEAARMGTASPQHVRLAEQIIVRCRRILRQPTWWEPCRKYLPKANPGAP